MSEAKSNNEQKKGKKKPQKYKPGCWFYIRGQCTKGDDCRFRHHCLHFARGRCRFGDLCRLDHGGWQTQKQTKATEDDKQKALEAITRAWYSVQCQHLQTTLRTSQKDLLFKDVDLSHLKYSSWSKRFVPYSIHDALKTFYRDATRRVSTIGSSSVADSVFPDLTNAITDMVELSKLIVCTSQTPNEKSGLTKEALFLAFLTNFSNVFPYAVLKCCGPPPSSMDDGLSIDDDIVIDGAKTHYANAMVQSALWVADKLDEQNS